VKYIKFVIIVNFDLHTLTLHVGHMWSSVLGLGLDTLSPWLWPWPCGMHLSLALALGPKCFVISLMPDTANFALRPIAECWHLVNLIVWF